MNDIYLINEVKIGEEIKKKPANLNNIIHNYKSDINDIISITLFIKAVKKAISKVNESLSLASSVKNILAIDIEMRSQEDSNKVFIMAANLDLAGQILTEFIKATSIVHSEDNELIQLFEHLNKCFVSAGLSTSLFNITKDVKYGKESIKVLEMVLALFTNMEKSLNEDNTENSKKTKK